MNKVLKIKPVMERVVHTGDQVFTKSGYWHVLAAYDEQGNPGCLLSDAVKVFKPNEVITDQEASVIMRKRPELITDEELKLWLEWRFSKYPAKSWDVGSTKRFWMYDEDRDGLTEDKYAYEKSVRNDSARRAKSSTKNEWILEEYLGR